MKGDFEGEYVFHLFGRRIRFYLGHSIYEGRRLKVWSHSTFGNRGIYLVPWGNRVVGVQFRPQTFRDRFDKGKQ